MTACSVKCLWAVSFSSLTGKLWTLMGQLCEGPGMDTEGCDQGQAASLPSPELPGLGRLPRNGAGAASLWQEAAGRHGGVGWGLPLRPGSLQRKRFSYHYPESHQAVSSFRTPPCCLEGEFLIMEEHFLSTQDARA